MTRTKTLLAIGVATLTLAGAGIAVSQDRGDGDRGPRGGGDRMAAHHGGDGHGMRGQARGGKMMERLLEAYDTDADGALTQEEIDTARAARLAEFDADGDGSLTLAEFEALWLDAMNERMVDRFQNHDDDGDGAVTVEEFGEDFARVVARMDRTGDGILNADDLGGRGGMRGDRDGAAPAPAE